MFKKGPNWLENDDDLNTNNIGTKAYIPPDIPADDSSLPNVSGKIDSDPSPSYNNEGSSSQGITPVVPNNFEGGVFSINHYRRYFNINTNDFFGNVINSINVISIGEKSNEDDNENEIIGDLYGPIWVTATVIFCLFFSNTSSNLIKSWLIGGDEHYQYNFGLLTGAISLLYGYTVLIPFIFYIVSVWYFKLENFFSLSKIISIYGYANSVWIPSAILGILRGLLVNHQFLSGILKWIVVLIGGLISGVSIGLKVFPILKNSTSSIGNDKLIFGLLGVLGIAHLGFIIAIKVLFFGDLKVVS
ncbi:putative membrane protein [Wickerhamomyces ciferrii]|uniref:Membrane protein n=1 Tax=Wickerhamomyces ciferrii (strain ATCC 14091 / BCRC 22168 / CBS 111 / JCM 3599 / NBRC 0793 / NRRL Y-1031 F-60-10) TaxID=1206466 RepID=K0KGE3_WICCF|nr:uncharacterized protein BN7_789 [Wickerhamomyces ciferrii]CCH41252.1 putative membrane protein [Wickerhamomyces ciferrii]